MKNKKEESALSKLYIHGLINDLLDESDSWMKEINKKKFKDGKFALDRPFTRDEVYTLKVFDYASEILEWFDHLQHIPHYLSGYRETKTMKKAGVSKPKFLTYQIENYLIRVNGLLDRVLKLIDAVFSLSNDPKYCYENVILKNSRVKDTAVPGTVKNLKKVLEKYNAPRNEVVHHRSYAEGRLTDLNFFSSVMHNSSEETKKRKKELFSSLSFLAEDFELEIIYAKKNEFLNFNKILEVALIRVFDVLRPIFLAELKKYKLLPSANY